VTAGTLVATPRLDGPVTDRTRARAWAEHRRAIRRALDRYPVDLVHAHGLDFHRYLPPPGVPVLTTLHLPPSWYPARIFRTRRPDTYLHCVSAAQRRSCPREAFLLPDIPNSVPVDALAARHARRGFALMLGRICPEKGFHLGLEAAALAETPVLLAGKVFPYPEHERYLEEEIRPRAAGRRVRLLGPLTFARKRRFLTAARCLLVPSLGPETSSLVAMESLACGTPVIAFRAGALPEIVEHGRTGFLVDDPREMAEAIRLADTIDPEECRRVARERFSLETMTSRYLALYAEILATSGKGRDAIVHAA
jgi:glycosyltransferase involved in cell wall biosynthesis